MTASGLRAASTPPARPRADPDAWIRAFHPPSGDRPLPRLVAFPHAGGSATFWHPLSAALRGRAEVLSVQYPGRQERRAEQPVDDLIVLADLAAEALAARIARASPAPLVLFGHSMGAILAFEVARRLASAPEPAARPTALVLSGRRSPDSHRDERVHTYDRDALVAELRSLSGTDTAILDDTELLEMVLPPLRADYRAIETYRFTPDPGRDAALDCPVTVLTGDADPKVSLAEAAAWREHTTGDFTLHAFPGGHFYLTDHQPAVIAHLVAALEIT